MIHVPTFVCFIILSPISGNLTRSDTNSNDCDVTNLMESAQMHEGQSSADRSVTFQRSESEHPSIPSTMYRTSCNSTPTHPQESPLRATSWFRARKSAHHFVEETKNDTEIRFHVDGFCASAPWPLKLALGVLIFLWFAMLIAVGVKEVVDY